MRRIIAFVTFTALLGAASPTDPFLWLENVHGTRAMAWVHSQNARTLAVLQRDSNFPILYADALRIAQAKLSDSGTRVRGGGVYNFWQDAQHVRGIWRRTTVAEFAQASPSWTTVLDLDAIAGAEKANWVWKGAECAWPREDRCLVSLSDGGEDAVTVREYDVIAKQFVAGGFLLPQAKQRAAWENDDTLLVAREWSPGDLTASGYPFVVKRVRRGEPLSSAVEVFRGDRSDGGYGVSPIALHDGAGNTAMLLERPLSTFKSEYYIITQSGPRRLEIPLQSQPSALVAGRLIFMLQEDWHAGGTTFSQGSLVSVDLAAARSDPQHLKPSLVFAPGPREMLDSVDQTSSRLLLTTYQNVRGREWIYTPAAGGGWTKSQLDLPDNSSVFVNDADRHGESAYPHDGRLSGSTTLWQLDSATAADFGREEVTAAVRRVERRGRAT